MFILSGTVPFYYILQIGGPLLLKETVNKRLALHAKCNGIVHRRKYKKMLLSPSYRNETTIKPYGR